MSINIEINYRKIKTVTDNITNFNTKTTTARTKKKT